MRDFEKVREFEQKIRDSIKIPNELCNNLRLATTGLGGVFLDYNSDTTNSLAAINSKVLFSIMFNTTDGGGTYISDNCGFEISQERGCKANGITLPRGIKKRVPYLEACLKINKFIKDNSKRMYELIENKESNRENTAWDFGEALKNIYVTKGKQETMDFIKKIPIEIKNVDEETLVKVLNEITKASMSDNFLELSLAFTKKFSEDFSKNRDKRLDAFYDVEGSWAINFIKLLRTKGLEVEVFPFESAVVSVILSSGVITQATFGAICRTFLKSKIK